MCFEDKMKPLIELLRPHVRETLSDAGKAQEMIEQHKATMNSQIAHMAENLYEYQERFGLTETLKPIGSHPSAKLSHLREAITLILREYIEEESRKEMVDLLGPAEAALRTTQATA